MKARALVLGVVLIGCGTHATSTSTGSGGTTSASSTSAGDMCPAGSHDTMPGCDTTLEPWSPGPLLTTARDHHVTFVTTTPSGTYLYAMLGLTAVSAPTSIERAAIAADGTLGAFQTIGNAPTGLGGPGLAQLDRSFVICGGLTNDSNSSTLAYVGQVADDGSVTFTPGPSMSESRYHVSASLSQGYVFAIGGLQQVVNASGATQKIEDAVERASFDGTTLGAWTTLAPLPMPLTHQSAVVYQNAIYLIGGGSSGAAASTAILRATVGADGSLGTWQHVGDLPSPRASGAATIFLDHLYVVGGMTSLTSGETATVLRAPIDAQGNVGMFDELASLPKARAHSHQAPLYDGHLYSVGGSISQVDQKESYFATLD